MLSKTDGLFTLSSQRIYGLPIDATGARRYSLRIDTRCSSGELLQPCQNALVPGLRPARKPMHPNTAGACGRPADGGLFAA
jgi:hypothetical protein